MNTKKYIIGAGIAMTILAGVASLVLAENMIQGTGNQGNNNNQEDASKMAMMGQHEGPEMVVQIGPNGKTTLRGTIESVGTGSINVKSWGGTWIVNIPPTANVMPTTDLTQFKVGDFVGVKGDTSQSGGWVINARIVRDWTTKKATQESRILSPTPNHDNEQKNGGNQGVQQQIQAILEQIKKIQEQIKSQQGQTTPSTSSGY